MDVVLLSRIQFALTIMFHYLFPPLSIGMGVILVYLDGQWLRTGNPVYEKAAKFWTRIFALNFAIGVASGIVMEFEFGTNWATYSRFVGDVFGSALAAEGIFAFFLESGFLAVLVFGWNRVGKRLHFFATLMVALGSIFSSIWIVVANSWQQTPAGHHIVPILRDGAPWVIDGQVQMRAEIVDFWAMVFNPSSMHRLAHVLLGCFIMGGAFVLSVSAWYLLRGRHRDFAERSYKGALVLVTISSFAILGSGHFQAENVYHTQPAKLAAFEGQFETGRGDLAIFGIPDAEAGMVHAEIAIPGALGLMLHGDAEHEVTGLDRFRPEDRPPVAIPYITYHLMIGAGMFFIALTTIACLAWWRGRLFHSHVILWASVFSIFAAIAANQAGWVSAEVGRQPWIVHPPVEYDASGALVLDEDGHVRYDEAQGLRTKNAASPALSGEQVLGSIIMFSLIYLLLGAVWLLVLNDKIQKGPEPVPGVDEAPAPPGGYLAAATRRASHEESMTDRRALDAAEARRIEDNDSKR